MSITTTQQLLERVTTLLRSESRAMAGEHGLQPVHLDVMYYLSICNRYSDSAAAITEYLGLTKGTISQSLKVLENRGLIEKFADKTDKRVTHLCITRDGKKLLASCLPSKFLQLALGSQVSSTETQLNHQLTELLRSLQKANGLKSFGQCISCSHNVRLEDGGYFCALTNEQLSVEDVKYICREHTVSEKSGK